jgi:hypothetical protein
MNEPDESGPERAYQLGQSPFQHKEKKPVLQRTFPVSQHLPSYRRRLQQLIRMLRERGVDFLVARAGREVIGHLQRTGTVALFGGEDHIQPTVHAAVAFATANKGSG